MTRKHKVLVVEDGEDARAAFADVLSQDGGFEVVVAEDGQAALEQLANGQLPDVILTDIHMPRLNGIKLAERVRQNPKTNHIPIVAMTGNPVNYRQAASEAGCRHIISKIDVYSEETIALLQRLCPPSSP